jgi:hypothetical protein
MYTGLHVKYPLFLSYVNETWILWTTYFRKIPKYQISWKSVLWKPICSMQTGGRQADRQTDMTNLIVGFRNFTKSPKNLWIYSTFAQIKKKSLSEIGSLGNHSHSRKAISTSSVLWNWQASKSCFCTGCDHSAYDAALHNNTQQKWESHQLFCCKPLGHPPCCCGCWRNTWEVTGSTVTKNWALPFVNDYECKYPIPTTTEFLDLCQDCNDASVPIRNIQQTKRNYCSWFIYIT